MVAADDAAEAPDQPDDADRAEMPGLLADGGERDVWTQLRLSRVEYERMRAWAARARVSQSLLLRRLLQRALEAGEDEQGKLP